MSALSGRLQRKLTPGLLYSQTVFEQRLGPHVAAASRWLAHRCRNSVLPEWRGEAEAKLVAQAGFVVGVDTDFPAIRRHRSIQHRCLANISRLPFHDASFDLVTANMVVEHLADPAAQFGEIARVLVPGGIFLFHTPNVRSYVIAVARLLPDGIKRLLANVMEGRAADDVYPTHYRANGADQIQTIARESGLTVAEIEFVTSTPAFTVFPPFVIPELAWIRQLQRRPALAAYRHTIICALRRT